MTMDTSKLVPNDPRVRTESAVLRGKKYTYLIGEPEGTPIDTIVLCHGWPDIAFGWRYQIPFLMAQGYRVVAPNMLGYSGTDRPQAVEEFSLKSISDDLRELVRQLVGEDGQIILGGHDWGGALVWRTVLWHPRMIKAVFSVCTPFFPPRAEWVALEDLNAAGHLLNFAYQLHLGGPEVEARVQGPDMIRQLLRTLYGGRTPSGEVAFDPARGVLLDKLPDVGPSPLVSPEEIEYYVSEYMRQEEPQMRGPLNWYRTRRVNWEEDKELVKPDLKVEVPSLFIAATKDSVLLPELSRGMDKFFENYTTAEVEASHWALWQTPDAVNQHILDFLKKNAQGGQTKASL